MNEKPIIVVQGGQWGSEGKGMVAGALCLKRNVDYAIRTGGVNAGHTVYYQKSPIAFKMQQLPTGWVNPKTQLVIGAGAYIYPSILANEIMAISEATGETAEQVKSRIWIDYRAGLHLPEHVKRAQVADRHHLMGATGKGCSEAIIDKIRLRGNTTAMLFAEWLIEINSQAILSGLQLVDVEHMMNAAYDGGKQLLVEGTQGDLLDLHLGRYPFVSNKQTGVCQWLMEIGLSPNLEYEIILCLRTYPIRVAGNSGPMLNEITWTMLAERINRRIHKFHESSHLVMPWALDNWTNAQVELVAKWASEHRLPNANAYDFYRWSANQRYIYRNEISEFHAEAFKMLDEATKEELGKLFEFTTVTKKLRRIAEFNIADAEAAVRRSRPDSICLTFLNYWYPEIWDADELGPIGGGNQEIEDYIDTMSKDLDTPVRYVTTGPRSEHLIEIDPV